MIVTFGNHTLQTNNVLVGELAHDAGLTQEVLPLLLNVAWLQRLNSHRCLFASRNFQDASVNLSKLTYSRAAPMHNT